MAKDPMTDTPADLAARLKPVARCLGFFASVIKSGEPWTETCQRDYDAANEALSSIALARLSPPPAGVMCNENKALSSEFGQSGSCSADAVTTDLVRARLLDFIKSSRSGLLRGQMTYGSDATLSDIADGLAVSVMAIVGAVSEPAAEPLSERPNYEPESPAGGGVTAEDLEWLETQRLGRSARQSHALDAHQEHHNARIDRILSALPHPVAIGGGWVTVPVTPTVAMLNAGRESGHVIEVWSAMLAAAPAPGGG